MKIFSILFCLLTLALYGDNPYSDVDVYKEIKDITRPTHDDFRKVQDYLTNGERSILRRVKDYEPNCRNLKIITDEHSPESGVIAVNCSLSDRENCIVCYTSFNKNYPRGLTRLIDTLSKSDYKGHILWMRGGWPDIRGGSLVLAHIPYAFKVSFLKEARTLGYKRAFWLDTSIVPVVSMNVIFDMIADKGYFCMGNVHNIGPWMDPLAADAFGLSMADLYNIPSCSAGITGLDFTKEIGNKILNAWYRAAHNKVAFFSPRSDQNALSIILHNLGIHDLIDINKHLARNRSQITKDTLLLIEREYVNELSGNAH